MKRIVAMIVLLLLASVSRADPPIIFNDAAWGYSAAANEADALIWAYDDAWDQYEDDVWYWTNRPGWINETVTYLNSDVWAEYEDGIWWGYAIILYQVSYEEY